MGRSTSSGGGAGGSPGPARACRQQPPWRRRLIHAIEQLTGRPLTAEQLAHFEDRRALTDHLRGLTCVPQSDTCEPCAPPFEPPTGPVFDLR